METGYFYFSEKSNEKSGVFQTILTSVFFTGILFSLLICLFAGNISALLSYQGRENIIYWIAFILFTDAFTAIPFAKLRRENKTKKFATLKLINIGLNLFLNFFFLYLCPKMYVQNADPSFPFTLYNPDWNVEYVFLSNLLANLIYIPLLLPQLKEFRLKLDVKLWREIMTYSLPMLIVGIAGMVNEVLDRILLRFWLPENFYPGLDKLGTVGIYGACYKFSIFMTLGIQAFRFAAEPFFFSKAKEKNSPVLFANVMDWFISIGTLIFLFISLNLDSLKLLLLRTEYHQGLQVVPILLLANLFLGIYYNLSVWYKVTGKTRYGMWISLLGALVTLIGNFALIPVLGYKGSAIATLICYVGIATLCYLWGARFFPVPYKIKNAFYTIGSAVVLVILADWIFIFPVWINELIFVGYLAVIFLVKRNKINLTKQIG